MKWGALIKVPRIPITMMFSHGIRLEDIENPSVRNLLSGERKANKNTASTARMEIPPQQRKSTVGEMMAAECGAPAAFAAGPWSRRGALLFLPRCAAGFLCAMEWERSEFGRQR